MLPGCAGKPHAKRSTDLLNRIDGASQCPEGKAPDVAPGQYLSTKAKNDNTVDVVCPREARLPTPRRIIESGRITRAERRDVQLDAWSCPMPSIGRAHPDLGFENHGSISVGSIANGYLVNGVELPFAGEHHVVMAEHQTRATNYGTDEMVAFILDSAKYVASAFPNSLLSVGNIGRAGGGRIPWSISHRAGRDVDLAFYMLDSKGNQVILPSMVSLVPPDGTVNADGEILTFDAAHNWALVKRMLESEHAEVDYIFCADFLIGLMFEHAQAEGVSSRILKGYRETIRQPRGTLPHDDHMHVRIRCSVEDSLDGCRNIVAGREQVPRSVAFGKRTRQLQKTALQDDSPGRRAAALRLMGIIKAPRTQQVAWKVLDECQEPVCQTALEALLAIEASPREKTLVRLISRSNVLGTVRAAFRLLRQSSPQASRRIWPLLKDDRVLVGTAWFFEERLVVREEACRALAHTGSLTSGKHIAPLLSDPEPNVRSAALWALRAISGGEVLPNSVLNSPLQDAPVSWRRYIKRHRDVRRNLRRTLEDRGYNIRYRLDRRDARQLLNAIRDVDFISLGAQRRLRELYKGRIPIQVKDKEHARYLWKKVVRRVGRR
jgi:murein endopeptidase